jgi:hypothetical protein
MSKNSILNWLVPLTALLAAAGALAGLLAPGGSGPYTFVTLHGQSVEMFGRGVYQYDTLLVGAGFRGTDAITLLIALPLLLTSHVAARRGGRTAALLRIGALFYCLYNGASKTFSAAYNPLFLLYTAQFMTGFYAALLALAAVDARDLARRACASFPHRGMAAFAFVAGIGTLLIWLSEIIPPLLSGTVPATLGPYTSLFTHGFDSAVITPAAVLTGVLLRRREPLGYLLAGPIMTLCALIGAVVIGQAAAQALAGLVFPIGVMIGMIGSWIAIGAWALVLLGGYQRGMAP